MELTGVRPGAAHVLVEDRHYESGAHASDRPDAAGLCHLHRQGGKNSRSGCGKPRACKPFAVVAFQEEACAVGGGHEEELRCGGVGWPASVRGQVVHKGGGGGAGGHAHGPDNGIVAQGQKGNDLSA